MSDQQNQSPVPELEIVPAQSPTVPLQVEYTFPDALKQVILGRKITKLEWKNPEIYGVLDGGLLKLHKADDKLYAWTINDGDLTGEDWVIL